MALLAPAAPPVTSSTDPSNGSPGYFSAWNGKLYMQASRPDVGNELFVYDPVALSTNVTLVADIAPGPLNSSNPNGFTAAGGILYFAATAPLTGIELYSMTAAQAVSLVFDLNPGA